MKNLPNLNSLLKSLAAVLALATVTTHASAAPVSVVNGGFEPDATFTLTNTASGYVGSSGFGTNQSFGGSGFTGPGTADVLGFTSSPGAGSTVQLLGTNYENAGGVSTGFVGTIERGGISETLSANLQRNSVYTLTFDASHRPDQFNYVQGTFSADLEAGGTILVPVSGTTTPDLTGTFQEFTLTFDTAAVAPNQALSIVFDNASPAGSAQVLIANVSLDVTGRSVPEPSSLALLLTGIGAAAFLARWRLRRS